MRLVLVTALLFVGGTVVPGPASAATPDTWQVDFGQARLGQQVTRTVPVIPDYIFEMVSSVRIEPEDAAFSAVLPSDGCLLGQPCDVTLTFTPSALGDVAADAVVTSCVPEFPGDGGFCTDARINLFGRGQSDFSVQPTNLDFGTVVVGDTATQPVTVSLDPEFQVVGAGPSGPWQFDLGTCEGVPSPGNCQARVSFAPTAVGAVSTDILITECLRGENPCSQLPLHVTGTAVLGLSVATTTLPAGQYGTAYPATTLQAVRGTGPLTWSVATGSLPPGLTLSPAGLLAGTPMAIGTFPFTVKVTDHSSPVRTATRDLSVTVTPGSADLAVSLGATPNPVGANKTLTYTATVRNAGPAAAQDVRLTDVLPSTASFIEVKAAGFSCQTPAAGATGTAICTLPTLGSGVSKTVVFTVKLSAKKATVDDTVRVSHGPATIDSEAVNDAATVTVRVK
jgi:uncharacterized repeat protein (TIGR01451 family)